MIAKLHNDTSVVIIEIQFLNRQALDQLALYNTAKIDGTKLMIEELYKGFQTEIYFREIQTPQLRFDQ
ncbi:hypothetical protein [Microcoleus asticus]|uniref:Uncharacterized protein n=1 Tax=Microcoleus asticus IPMA8 TaxID=2563858 RepID=A0ABX2D7J1_9CYAN|nr:hypothetical protein [Microcoleus asticus]NQE37783.1 hypothetical protein [Microcoleus asticus IPMA8]